MKILSIETSCDETAVALLDISGPLNKPEIQVLGNSLFSQVHLHEQYGGVYPNLAKREHEKNLNPLLEKTLKQARESITNPSIDLIAVTAGPGLEPALWAGITFAEELGKKWAKPVIPVDHMEGHVFSVLYQIKMPLALPALALLVSGGHTELVLVRDFRDYKILGQTVDDAVGEAFDKVARMLGLTYPGGPKISKLADKSRERMLELDFKFPRPMLNSGDLNFSYSGLKTAVLYRLKTLPELTEEVKEDTARAFQDAALEVLVTKTRKALEELDVKSLIVGGGVANDPRLQMLLQAMVRDFPHLELFLPEKSVSTDNAIMIGIASYIRVENDQAILKTNTPILAKGNLSIST